MEYLETVLRAVAVLVAAGLGVWLLARLTGAVADDRGQGGDAGAGVFPDEVEPTVTPCVPTPDWDDESGMQPASRKLGGRPP